MAFEKNFSFSIEITEPNKAELKFSFYENVLNNPTFYLELLSDNPSVIFNRTVLPIVLDDFFFLSESEKKVFTQAGETSKAGTESATTFTTMNNFLNPGNSFSVKGSVLIQTFQLLRFVNISYPPNVLVLFDSKLSSFLKDFEISVQPEDGYLEGPYYKFELSRYNLNNVGSYMIGGWSFLFLGVVAKYFIPYLKRKIKNNLLALLLQTIEDTLVWNIFLTHFLSKYMILVFTGAS